MKALVTGAAGFVGSTLCGRLLREGWDVVGIDALTDYYDIAIKRENLARLPVGVDFRHDDLNTTDLDALLDGVDVVFHQAGQPGVRSSWGQDFETYVTANVLATQRLLEAVRSATGLRRFVYASSSSVYGDAQQFPTTEFDVTRPVSPYGVTKLAAEHLCTLYASNFDVPTVSLRYFTVFGPGQRPDMAFTRFLTAVAQGRAIDLYGTGEQVRDFTYVDDIVEANLRAALETVPAGAVMNIAGGTNVSVNEVFDIIGGITGSTVAINRHPRSHGDVFRTGGEASLARDLLGWKPVVSVEEGLMRQWEWVCDRLG